MKIRKVALTDRAEWARMRKLLWPDSLENHLMEIDTYFSGGKIHVVEVFVLDWGNGQLGGFIELNVRNFAEGSIAVGVPYIEGWYVDAYIRRQGHGKRLLQAAERWAFDNGFGELASDSDLANAASIAAHQAAGFEEVGRSVCTELVTRKTKDRTANRTSHKMLYC